MGSKPRPVFEPEAVAEEVLPAFDLGKFVDSLWGKAPVSISRAEVDEGLIKAGIPPATARRLVQVLLDQEGNRIVLPKHDPPTTMRIVSDYLQRAVDSLLEAGAPLQVVELVCEGIPGYVLKKIEDAKRARRKSDQQSA